MGARLRVFLTRKQDEALLKLRNVDVRQKVKNRAEVVRLNAHGWYVERVATHFNWTTQTVREVLHRWEKLGLEGLWELPGRGGKPKYKEIVINLPADLLNSFFNNLYILCPLKDLVSIS
jgi:hypothetical protein